jgi:threonine/homoserine/homoserine lactone efflux protein
MTTINDMQKHGHAPMKGSLSMLFNPNIVAFLLSILPQFDGSPGVQALLVGLLSIVSGTTMNLLKTAVGARARDCLLVRQMLCEGFRRTFKAVF